MDNIAKELFTSNYNDIAFIFISYNTPIAWIKYDGSFVVDKTFYSMTSSKHRNKIIQSINEMDKVVLMNLHHMAMTYKVDYKNETQL